MARNKKNLNDVYTFSADFEAVIDDWGYLTLITSGAEITLDKRETRFLYNLLTDTKGRFEE